MHEPTKNPFDLLLEQFRGIVREEIQAALNGSQANAQDDRMVTADEAAAYLNCSLSWVYHNWRKIGGRKLGRKGLRFSRRELERWIASRKF